MVSVRNLRWSYRGSGLALDDVSLDVRRAEVVALVGPSGCGKTTLLRCLLGLITPDQGEVALFGQRLGADNVRPLRRRLGYLVQGGGLFPHLSALENVTLVGRYLRLPQEALRSRVLELLELTRLPAEILARRPAQLSGGQAQRVGLMRALMLDPELLILDEPLGSLDPIARYHLQEELKDLFTRLGKTVIFVTHDLTEAVLFGTRLVLMRGGRVEQQGSFEQLARSPASGFVTEFIRAHRSLPSEAPP
jgi:osmoprotectant transport system ATP-binding protein